MTHNKVAIVGAGVAGAALAHIVSRQSAEENLGLEVTILEKSRGVGGRLATRRTDKATFDHGAQFYKLSEASRQAHAEWSQSGLVQKWFNDGHRDAFSARGGMTSLIKNWLSNENVRLNTRVETIERASKDKRTIWMLNSSLECDTLVLTAPLPQSLELVSQLAADTSSLTNHAEYHSAVVGLFTLAHDVDFTYLEPSNNSPIFSLANQASKNVSAQPAVTVTMGPDFSHEVWPNTDDAVLELITSEFLKAMQWPDRSNILKAELKRWRYSHPKETVSLQNKNQPSLFSEFFIDTESESIEKIPIKAPLYICGDAFGGGSINGALRSAIACAEQLLNRQRKIAQVKRF